MTNKELKNYMKSKADKIEVKDFSKAIIERMKSIPQETIEVIEKPRHAWRIKPLTTSFLVLMTSFVFVLFLIQSIGTRPPVEDPVFQSMEDVVALSSVQATSLIEIMDQELSLSRVTTLRFGPVDKDNKIKDELADLSKYLDTIEKLYASNETFDFVDQEKRVQGFGRQMRFRTKNLTNQESVYDLFYDQTLNRETKAFNIQGVIKTSDQTFYLNASGIKGEKQIHMTISNSYTHEVVLDYQEEEGIHLYRVELKRANETVQVVTIELEKEGLTKKATLSFIEGSSQGTYVFQVIEEELKKIIQIRYILQFDDEIEEGTITVRILSLPTTTQYSMMIKPDGRPPFSITQGRRTTGSNANPL